MARLRQILSLFNVIVALANVAGKVFVPAHENAMDMVQTWEVALDGNQQGQRGQQVATPVSRVVKLLKDMKLTIEKEMNEDEELYEKLACWCANNGKAKTDAIGSAQATTADLKSSIESLAAQSQQLVQIIADFEKQLADAKAALDAASSLREKESKDFHAQELFKIQAVENLKSAIMVIERHHGASLPQLSGTDLLQKHSRFPWGSEHESADDRAFDQVLESNGLGRIADGKPFQVSVAETQPPKFLSAAVTTIPKIQKHHADLSAEGWTAQDIEILQRARHVLLMQNGQSNFDFFARPAVASTQVLRVLKQLRDELTSELDEERNQEVAHAAAFKELSDSKTREMATTEEQREDKREILATTEQKLADAKEDLEDTNNELSQHEKFLVSIKTTCKEADGTWETRRKARLEEIQVVGETIAFLTSDEAKDTFSRTFSHTSFIQTSSRMRLAKGSRTRAAKLLSDAAAKSNNPQLSILATQAEFDAFARVKKVMDEMVAKLKLQQADEVKKKDWCDSEFQSNAMTTAEQEIIKKNQEVIIADLESSITTLTDELEQAKAQVDNLQLNMQRASEERQQSSLDFQQTVADQKATQEILAIALEKLAKFYDEESFLQSGHASAAPAVAQTEYKKSAGGNGAMSMIEKLIYDAKELEKDAIISENSAQAQYESLVEDTNGSVAALQDAIVVKTKAMSGKKVEIVELQEELEGTMEELEGLSKYNAELRESCDYILKNFAIRQKARADEIEAILQAKQVLSGAA